MIHSEEHGPCTLSIFQDPDSCDPRKDYDCLGTIYHTHRNYDLGVKDSLESIELIVNDSSFISIPVYMYEHGSVMLQANYSNPFTCPWDSGQVGVIAVKKAKVLKEWGKKRWSKKLEKQVIEALKGEIRVFSDYLQGNVYGYVIENTVTGEQIDSCWGFIGDSEDCLNEGRANLPKGVKKVA